VVTPAFHGIRHDVDHLATNDGSGLTLWDRLFGTAVTGLPQDTSSFPGGAARHGRARIPTLE
jgi:sterol desaturase/sphingolipid hydroxylase (fatty acid hydroxylase superfamily)